MEIRPHFVAIVITICVTWFSLNILAPHFLPSLSQALFPFAEVQVTEGTIVFEAPDVGTAQTWYRVFGDLRGRKRKPIVLLHGGPGYPHQYLLSLSMLAELHSIPVILYDQVGSGKSTHLPSKNGNETFWTPQIFIDELSNLLSHFNLDKEGYDLLGHSWGGMLASNHAILRPKGLRRLILVSPPASMKLWVDAQAMLRSQLPNDIRDVLDKHESQGTIDSKEYKEAVEYYSLRHAFRLPSKPPEFRAAEEAFAADRSVYLTMNGPTDFYCTGSLRTWSVVDDVHKINVPTLIINGKYDMAQDVTIEPFVRSIPNNKWVKFENSSHTSFLEEPQKFRSVLTEFLAD